MPAITSEIHVLNGTQLDWLTGIRVGCCCHVSVAIRNDVLLRLAKKVHFSSLWGEVQSVDGKWRIGLGGTGGSTAPAANLLYSMYTPYGAFVFVEN
jgi:hypothetical protein